MSESKGSESSAIFARNLGKMYPIYEKPVHRVWDMVLPGKKRFREFWAVRNVYLDIPPGGTIGIIGENGAGKSTLLQAPDGDHDAHRGARSSRPWSGRFPARAWEPASTPSSAVVTTSTSTVRSWA